jgi:hypothetical protein
MQARRARTLDAGRRVEGFLDENAAAIGAAITPVLRGKFADAVSRLAQAERDQTLAGDLAIGETTAAQRLRQDVYDRCIAPIAKAAAMTLGDEAEFAALQMPAELKQKRVFLAKASAVLEAATMHEAALVGFGLAPDFLEQLRAGITEVEASKVSRGSQVTRRTTATEAIATASKAVRDFIALLDRLLAPTLRAHPELKAGWTSAKSIYKVPVQPLPNGDDSADDEGDATPLTAGTPPAPAVTTQATA